MMAKHWTAEEEVFLYANYNNMVNAQLAEIFGVTPKAISHKMRRLRDRARREAERRERERLERERQQAEKKEIEEEYQEEEFCEPLNLPQIQCYEKMINIDGRPINLISTGFFVKTETGWNQIMMRKQKVMQ